MTSLSRDGCGTVTRDGGLDTPLCEDNKFGVDHRNLGNTLVGVLWSCFPLVHPPVTPLDA